MYHKSALLLFTLFIFTFTLAPAAKALTVKEQIQLLWDKLETKTPKPPKPTPTPKPANTPIGEKTVVKGKVLHENGDPLGGASVQVICRHNGADYFQNTISEPNGKYKVQFPQSQCTEGDKVNVNVSFGDKTGTGEGTVKNKNCDVDILTLRITLNVPEFGVVQGGLAFAFSSATYLLYRRKHKPV